MQRATGFCSASSWRRGFTLVELLVVIGIISVLISILLPALGRVRDQATGLKCQNNLRQIITGAQMYADANRNYFPQRWQWSGETDAQINPSLAEYYETTWTERLRAYVGKRNNADVVDIDNDGGKNDVNWVFHCPSVLPEERLNEFYPTAYGINTFMHARNDWGGSANWAYHRRGIGRRSSELIFSADKAYTNADEVGTLESPILRNGFVVYSAYDAGLRRWTTGQYIYESWAAPATRHHRKSLANTAFFDGHVEGLRAPELRLGSGRWNNWSPRG